MAHGERHVGVTLMPEYLQCEGIDAVLDRLERLGATAVTTMPSVAARVPEGQGSREPPLDAGAGAVRVLDRPLWGEHALHMVTAPSFSPDPSRYAGLAYQPPAPDALTASEGPIVGRFIAAAKARGLKVFLQVMAAIPPCFRVQFGGPAAADKPMLPGGRPLPIRVDNNASLASVAVRDYVRAMLADLCSAYPDADGIRFDWPEYPPYHPLSLFADYNPAVRPFAEAAGLDFDRLDARMGALHDQMVGGDILPALMTQFDDFDDLLARLIGFDRAFGEHFALRRHLVEDYAQFLARSVADASDGRMQVFLQCFPPPWNRLSGFAPSHMPAGIDLIGVKFYTMHWPMMVRHYGEAIAAATGSDPAEATRAAWRLLVGSAATPGRTIAYPEPDEPHGVSGSDIARKFSAAQSGTVKSLVAITHAYGPLDDVCARFEAAWHASGQRIEINRYGYLSDAKIDAIGRIVGP